MKVGKTRSKLYLSSSVCATASDADLVMDSVRAVAVAMPTKVAASQDGVADVTLSLPGPPGNAAMPHISLKKIYFFIHTYIFKYFQLKFSNFFYYYHHFHHYLY